MARMGFQGVPNTEFEALDGLTARATDFLHRHATREFFRHDPHEDDLDARTAAVQHCLAVDDVARGLAGLQERFGGLQYRSRSWNFEEVIGFAPVLDLDDEDTEPMVSLIEHTVAHPFGVWATLRGSVYFLFGGGDGGEYLKVFDHIEALIESDAVHAECARWIPVAEGRGDSLSEVESTALSLDRIDEASGDTESWWEGDGFRVHVWRTYALLFEADSLARWSVWASTEADVEKARAFLEDAAL